MGKEKGSSDSHRPKWFKHTCQQPNNNSVMQEGEIELP